MKSVNFNENDPVQVSLYDELPLWSAPFGLMLLDTVKFRKGINILDIGSGCGFPLTEIAQRFGSTCKVYGVEPWSAGVERIRKKQQYYEISNVSMLTTKAESLIFFDDFFELITSNNGLNNVSDIEKVLNECRRVLKPGGQMVFTVNLPETMIEFYSVFEEVLLSKSLNAVVLTLKEHIASKRKSVKEWNEKLINAGFDVTNVKTGTFQYRFTDAETMLNYYFFRLAFLESWLQLVPSAVKEEVFSEVSEMMNMKDEIVLTIPFACFDTILRLSVTINDGE